MNNFIIEGFIDEAKKYIENLLEERKIKAYNILFFEEIVKIDQAREIKKILSFQSSDPKAFIFLGGLTIEAQNSLLKIIEETNSACFIFYSKSKEDFLPTIRSRCKIVSMQKEIDVSLAELFRKYNKIGFAEIDEIQIASGSGIDTLLPSLRELILDNTVATVDRRKYYLYLKRYFSFYPLHNFNNVNEKIILEYIFAD